MSPTETYEVAYLDAALVNAVAGKPREPFWQQAYCRLIELVRTAAEVVALPEPSLGEIAGLVADPVRLNGLVLAAVAAGSVGDEPARVGDLRRWLDADWLQLPERLREQLVGGLAAVAGDARRVARSVRGGRREPVPLGSRVGSWDGWDLSALPADVGEAVAAARRVLRPDVARSPVPASGPGPLPDFGSVVAALRTAAASVRDLPVAAGVSSSAPSARPVLVAARRGAAQVLEQAVDLVAAVRLVRGPELAALRAHVRNAATAARSYPVSSQAVSSQGSGGGSRPAAAGGEGISRRLDGAHVCVVGRFSVPHRVVVRWARDAGAERCTNLVSGKTTFVVHGALPPRHAGFAVARRRRDAGQAITFLDEGEFRRRLGLLPSASADAES